MSEFPKVSNFQVNENFYDIKDNVNREELQTQKARTASSDAILQSNKVALAEAITNKGITTEATDSLITMAENITKMETGNKPAITPLVQYTSTVDNVFNNTVRYLYPWIHRLHTNKGILASNNTGGMEYNGENETLKNLIFITRFHRYKAGNPVPVLFCSGLIDIDFQIGKRYSSNNNLKVKLNKNTDIEIVIDEYTINDVTDFYLKVEQLIENTNVKVNIYTSSPNVDGKPENFVLKESRYITPESFSSNCILSVLGTDMRFVDSVVNNEVGYPDKDGYYGNYLPETCIVKEDDAGIYKVALGASSLYPYPTT